MAVVAVVAAAWLASPAGGVLKVIEPQDPGTAATAEALSGSIEISDLAFSVAQIECFKSNKLIARAAGFFYEADDRLYLITSRHVVYDPANGHVPDALKLRLHTDRTDIRKNDVRKIDLYTRDGFPRWLEHPEKGSDVDVVALPLGARYYQTRYVVTAFSRANNVPEDIYIHVGEDVIVVGYPLGLYDEEYNLPIVRRGTVASFYPIPFEGEPYFLMDCRLHSGCSGSPVLTKPGGIMQTRDARLDLSQSPRVYLLGVNSARVGKAVTYEEEEPLGLYAVWFTYLIEEIIAGK
ncbi:MAG: serine protease [Candidatus Zixiibacteriota bacterium]|jgi:S1-C subfamily serine protease